MTCLKETSETSTLKLQLQVESLHGHYRDVGSNGEIRASTRQDELESRLELTVEVSSSLHQFQKWVLISNGFMACCWLLIATLYQFYSIENQHMLVSTIPSFICNMIFCLCNVVLLKTIVAYTHRVIKLYLRDAARGHSIVAHRSALQFAENTFTLANWFNLVGGVISHVFSFWTNRDQLLMISLICQIMCMSMFISISIITVYVYNS